MQILRFLFRMRLIFRQLVPDFRFQSNVTFDLYNRLLQFFRLGYERTTKFVIDTHGRAEFEKVVLLIFHDVRVCTPLRELIFLPKRGSGLCLATRCSNEIVVSRIGTIDALRRLLGRKQCRNDDKKTFVKRKALFANDLHTRLFYYTTTAFFFFFFHYARVGLKNASTGDTRA